MKQKSRRTKKYLEAAATLGGHIYIYQDEMIAALDDCKITAPQVYQVLAWWGYRWSADTERWIQRRPSWLQRVNTKALAIRRKMMKDGE